MGANYFDMLLDIICRGKETRKNRKVISGILKVLLDAQFTCYSFTVNAIFDD